MTWDELKERFKRVKIVDISNLEKEGEIEKLEQCGLTPELFFNELLDAMFREFIDRKFFDAYMNEDSKLNFESNPLEFVLIDVIVRDCFEKMKEKALTLFKPEELIKYIDNKI